MKPDNIHDALNHLDDDLIASADKLRNAPHSPRIRYTKALALVASVCVMLTATILLARYASSKLTDDGADFVDVKGDKATDVDQVLDGAIADMGKDDAAGVTLKKRIIDESYKISESNPAIDYFCHDGRIYVPYQEIVYRPYNEVVGEKLGTVTNVFLTEPYGDYYGELHGNMSYDVYKMKDYDERFMLAVDVDGSFYVFINDNGFTLETGADILRDRFELEGGFSGVTMQYYQGEWMSTVQKQSYEVIERFISVLCDARAVSAGSEEVGHRLCLAMLRFEHHSGTLLSLSLYDGGYVFVLLGSSGVTLKLDEKIFDEYIAQLGDIKFNPDSFVSGIPTPPIERFVFHHKIFPTTTYLFLYSDAHYWPEELMDSNIRYDRSSLKVYCYDPNNSANGIGTVTLAFPDGFDTTYDHATPVYATGGGGSCECEIVFRLDYGNKKVYAAFNNFAWTSDILDFEYAGIVDEALVKKSMPTALSKATT